jgi:hypothetical protein
MPAGGVLRLDRPAVHPFTLRRLDAEGLAGQVEVELELPRVDGAEKIQRLAQVAVRVVAIAVADQVALRDDPVDRRADHQERAVELPAVEGDEAGVGVEELPELLQDLLLGAGDVRPQAGLLDPDVGLPRHFVERAGAAVLDVDDADGDDAPAERRQAARAASLFGLALGEAFDEVLANVGVVLFPRKADGLDVDDELFHPEFILRSGATNGSTEPLLWSCNRHSPSIIRLWRTLRGGSIDPSLRFRVH